LKRRFLSLLCFFVIFILHLLSGPATAFQGSGQAEPLPWSGYWWPMLYGGLSTGFDYRGHPAPLEKYLLLTTSRSSGKAIDWYEDRYYNRDAEGWWGLCPAYARAAVKEAYTILPSSEDNIVFRVGDKKGLLTVCHDDRSGIVYASGDTPVNFHQWLLDYIGDQKKAFTADMNAGREVWYHPVYGYEIESSRSGSTEQVEVTVYYAADDVPPDYRGTKEEIEQYTYDLFLDSRGNITGGEWTGASVSNHPETLAYPETTGPLNPYLDYEKIREISRSRDDFLEKSGNEPSRLLPGTYYLVLLNSDQYQIYGETGDRVFLELTREPGSNQDMDVLIRDGADAVVRQHTLASAESTVQYRFELDNPPYSVSVSQADYSDPNIYTLGMNLRSSNDRIVHYIPKNGPWSGVALTNASGEQAADVMLVTGGSDGRPIDTVYGPVDIAPNEKRLLNFSLLPVRDHEYRNTEFLRLISKKPVDIVNLFAGREGPMASFVGETTPVGNRMVIVDIYESRPWNSVFMRGALTNETFEETGVTFHVYSASGDLTSTFDQSLGPDGRLDIRPGTSPFVRIPHGGWIEIVADPGSKLSGYQYVETSGAQAKTLETNLGLGVSEGLKMVPHITSVAGGAWETGLTLINPNPESNPVTFHPTVKGNDSSKDVNITLKPFEKRSMDISTRFGDLIRIKSRRSILEISSAHPITGFFSYAATAGDTATYPLMDEGALKQKLVMPHSTQTPSRWWTGVGICNPNTHPVTVFALPFDSNGQAMVSGGAYIDLSPGAYEVFSVFKKFPGVASDIAYIEFSSDNPEGTEIGGFYLYGNSAGYGVESRKLLSGGLM